MYDNQFYDVCIFCILIFYLDDRNYEQRNFFLSCEDWILFYGFRCWNPVLFFCKSRDFIVLAHCIDVFREDDLGPRAKTTLSKNVDTVSLVCKKRHCVLERVLHLFCFNYP